MKIDFGVAVAVAGVVGFFVYLVACAVRRVLPPIDKALEAIGFGAAIVIGVRMMYGAFHAEELCHIVDNAGKLVEDDALHIKFGEHAWEIFAGELCIVLASIFSLGWLCRRPSHHDHESSITQPDH